MAKGLMSVSERKDEESNQPVKDNKIRNLVAFWILGLCNNYGYVVMLSAAHDILSERFTDHHETTKESNFQNGTIATPVRDCNTISAGMILLADILPCLVAKIIFPFVPYFINLRVLACILFSIGGFLLVALGETSVVIILGIVLTSISSGLGELTIIAYCNRFNKHVISSWSSGTGGAGVLGAASYACLKLWLSTKDTILLMLVIPVLEAIAFWLILEHPKNPTMVVKNDVGSNEKIIDVPEKLLKDKLRLVPTLLKYMIPLGLVYLFEYFINQGLLELLEFRSVTWLSHSGIYRWLQVDYQIGVFISRSSAVLFTFNQIWLMSVLQFVNVVFILFESIYFFTPSIWIIFALVFWEGLLGGGAYVNTFYKMSNEVPSGDRESAFSIVVLADSIGIALAGWLSMPVHNTICQLPLPTRKS